MIQNYDDKVRLEARWVKIVTVILWITVVWNVIEGTSSLYFGYLGDDISLFAFGVDSLIEVLSASLVLYHMMCNSLPKIAKNADVHERTPLKANHSQLFSLETERKLTLFIGCLLVIFCLFAIVGGTFRLTERIAPSSTRVGIIIGGICIVAMLTMYYYKMKAAVILKSSTLASDAACSFGCTKLSTVLCIGSILYEVWPSLWWVDAVTAILIALLVGCEGYQTIKGAKDRETFQGGCGCCGATDSGMAKYLREHFERELGYTTLGKDDKEDAAAPEEEACADACCEPKGKDKSQGKCGDKARAEVREELKEVRYGLYGAVVKDRKPAANADAAVAVAVSVEAPVKKSDG